jgi:type 1 glutamine amidotransferase
MNSLTRKWPGSRLCRGVASLVGAVTYAHAAVFLSPNEVADALPASEHRVAIEQAIPDSATVAPRKARRLLVFDRNVNYGGHPSAAHANYAFSVMGRKTGAFEAAVSRDPSAFEAGSLETFDAVFFNNNVGNLFEEPRLRQSLVDFVVTGGGMLGVHGTSVAFTRWPGAHEDWPEFGWMLGARGANHRISTEHVFIQLDDREHPLNRAFGGKDFEYRDEFFRVHEPYSRDRVRVLFRIDTARTDMNQGQGYGRIERADQDYALAWLRSYGRGRTFYCTIAHNPYVFSDPLMLRFYLDAIQFALGDLEAPTTPSARLTPAIRAREQLGWHLAAIAPEAAKSTLFFSMDRASALGQFELAGSGDQLVSADIPALFAPGLVNDQLQQIRLKLNLSGLRLMAYDLKQLPKDEPEARRSLAFARAMGVETVILAEVPLGLDRVAVWCEELELRLAIRASGSAEEIRLEELLGLCRQAGPSIGIAADLGEWMLAGLDPAKTLRLVGDRLFVVRLPAVLPDLGDQRRQVTGMGPWLEAIHEHATAPILFTVDLSGSSPAHGILCHEFDSMTLRLAR